MSTPFWRPWRDETQAEPIDKETCEEAARAVREFRDRKVDSSMPLTRVDQHQFTREPVMPVFDAYTAQAHQYMERIPWVSWYELPIPSRHHEPLPSWDSRWMTIRMEE